MAEAQGQIEEVKESNRYLRENMILDSRGIKKLHTAGQSKNHQMWNCISKQIHLQESLICMMSIVVTRLKLIIALCVGGI